MSEGTLETRVDFATGAYTLLALAAGADARAHRGLMVAVDDFFLPEDARLDERMRAELTSVLSGLINAIEAELCEHAQRQLQGRGEAKLVAALHGREASMFVRLSRSGLLRDPELMAELMARVRQELIGAALPMHAPDDPERPSLINRFVQNPDRVVATGAMAMLIAESRRRASPESGQFIRAELPAELHHRLVWWTAAAIRERVAELGVDTGADAALDRALSEAAQRSLAAYDEGDRLEAAAMRFAAAIDAQEQELPGLLVEALGDRRIVLFVALLAHALGVGYAFARDLVIDAQAERLWVALRALELAREPIAQIGYALFEADPRRDLEKFADTLDAIAAIRPDRARDAMGPLWLDPNYRAAVIALQRAGGKG